MVESTQAVSVLRGYAQGATPPSIVDLSPSKGLGTTQLRSFEYYNVRAPHPDALILR